jgi:hypothetical protein
MSIGFQLVLKTAGTLGASTDETGKHYGRTNVGDFTLNGTFRYIT